MDRNSIYVAFTSSIQRATLWLGSKGPHRVDAQLVTLIVAIVGATGSVLAFVAGRRERAALTLAHEASAASDLSDSYMKLVDKLEKRIEIQSAEITQLTQDLQVLKSEKEDLKRENRRLVVKIAKLEEENAELSDRVAELERLTKAENDM